MAQLTPNPNTPSISINLGNTPAEAASNSIQIFLLLTVLSLVPAIFVMFTSFARLTIVLSFTRQALGTQNVPSNQILAGLAMIMTFYIMAPTFRAIKTEAYDPMKNGDITLEHAWDRATVPLKQFMLKHTREKDLALFVHLSKSPKPATRMDVPMEILTPAFIISELKTAFEIGFLIFIPFLIVDLVVASILLAMGMMMLPPVMISMPFKILLFIMVDGWHLLVGSLVQSFN
ncbi:flagellar type III secretion system pore protein FliP [Sulfidibacter corallicola]|uniref:Flagellar biosynthetic protein FliP n=1 Tax=Sulfidibacter corallicola TaxID=2818388 RepID=A0A8A4TY17_SULCO|nr:flagellar type III secretion system pore protein FliP [Sulfidibacter corallicola]